MLEQLDKLGSIAAELEELANSFRGVSMPAFLAVDYATKAICHAVDVVSQVVKSAE